MKRLLLVLMISATVLSCGKDEETDPCEGVSCYNGGVCQDGSCDCAPGFTGANCETELNTDPCTNVECYNGGECVNGVCDCPDRWTGPSCEDQATPAIVRILKVDVLKFPATDDNGGGWDVSNGADIYIEIRNRDSGALLYDYPTGDRYENANPNGTHSFDVSPDLKLTDLSSDYQISIYDYDSWDADDFVGGVYSRVYTNTNGFPANEVWDAGGVRFRVYYSYEW